MGTKVGSGLPSPNQKSENPLYTTKVCVKFYLENGSTPLEKLRASTLENLHTFED